MSIGMKEKKKVRFALVGCVVHLPRSPFRFGLYAANPISFTDQSGQGVFFSQNDGHIGSKTVVGLVLQAFFQRFIIPVDGNNDFQFRRLFRF